MKGKVLSQPDRLSNEVYREVLAETVADLEPHLGIEEISSVLPTFENVRTALQRQRATIRPELPAGLILDDSSKKTRDGRDFLVIDDGTETRILGFCSEDALAILCQASTVYLDGTFRIVPSIFLQPYTLHAFFKSQMMPLCYFLLPDKEEATYRRMFTSVENYASTRVRRNSSWILKFQLSKLFESNIQRPRSKGAPFSSRKQCGGMFSGTN